MTEADWNNCTEPQPMLEFLRGGSSDRKLRLFAVACCRRITSMLTAESIDALDVAERFADGLADNAERKAARAAVIVADTTRHVAFSDPVLRHYLGPAKNTAGRALARKVWDGTRLAARGSLHVAACGNTPRREPEQATQVGYLRCIFGSPFRPVTLDSIWQTGTVVSLAQSIYDERAFERMPVLADALEDAGCTDPSILEHCRGGGQHVRGCWLVDLVLSKE
jgi:hypothetical protein